jgi:glycine reductase
LHYLNQFFGGIGGEERADTRLRVRDGPVGPGVELQRLLRHEARVVATLIAGDNYVHEHAERVADEAMQIAQAYQPHVLVAGPAFGSGRYGLACGLIGRSLQERLGVPAVTAMAPDNPAADLHRRWMFILPTGPTAADMRRALAALAPFALRLARGETIGPAKREGYLPRGPRRNELLERSAAERVLAMLHAKLAGRPFRTEIPLQPFEQVEPAPPIANLAQACLALVTECGLVPSGNPDRLRSSGATSWARYPLGPALDPAGVEVSDGGYDTSFARADPNRVLPVDALRRLERDGVFGRLHDAYFVTTGNNTPVARCAEFGRQIAQELRAAGVQGVVLPAT